MKITQTKNKTANKILTAVITNDQVCGYVSTIYKRDLFDSPAANMLAEWCIEHHKQYEKAPGEAIETLFLDWSQDKVEERTAPIEKLLGRLSLDYESGGDINAPFYIDKAAEYFTKVRLQNHKDQIEIHLERNEVAEAAELTESFTKVEKITANEISLVTDREAHKSALTSSRVPLVIYDDALRNFFDEDLARSAFVSILAPEKRGKSWWLQDIAWSAMEQGRNTAFFSVGDMTQDQFLRRCDIRAVGRPLKPKRFRVPTGIVYEPEERFAICEYEKKIVRGELTLKDVGKAMKKLDNKNVDMKICTYPNSTLSVLGIETIIEGWLNRGWIPDVIVIDYADILANPTGHKDERAAINETWKQLRALSQKYKCLVVTATQADAMSYNNYLMDMSNFSEDKRKFAHVTAMFGLNQSPDEKENGIYRLNWLVRREAEFDSRKCVHVAGCLSIARPAMFSTF